MKHHLLPVSPETVHWGYFSKKVAPALTLQLGRPRHHRNADPSRQRRLRAHDRRRSRRGERVPLDHANTRRWRAAAPGRPKARSSAAPAKASACIS